MLANQNILQSAGYIGSINRDDHAEQHEAVGGNFTSSDEGDKEKELFLTPPQDRTRE